MGSLETFELPPFAEPEIPCDRTAEPSASPSRWSCSAPLRFARLRDADAQVVHGTGFEATVAGWTSWYGSYQLAGVGQTWCIDHGLQAPDAAFGYRPARPHRPSRSRPARRWLGSWGAMARHPPRSTLPRTTLVLHDLNGAVYPQGALDVDQLAPSQLAGFGGAGRRRCAVALVQFKADGLAHAGLRAPLSLSLAAPSEISVGQVAVVTARVRDAGRSGWCRGPPADDPRARRDSAVRSGHDRIRRVVHRSRVGDICRDPPHRGRRRPEPGPRGVRAGRRPAQRVARSAPALLHASADVDPNGRASASTRPAT